MIIKNKDLEQMLKEKGRDYTLLMYANRYIHMSKKQFEYVLNYGGKNGKKIRQHKV